MKGTDSNCNAQTEWWQHQLKILCVWESVLKGRRAWPEDNIVTSKQELRRATCAVSDRMTRHRPAVRRVTRLPSPPITGRVTHTRVSPSKPMEIFLSPTYSVLSWSECLPVFQVARDRLAGVLPILRQRKSGPLPAVSSPGQPDIPRNPAEHFM